MEVSAQPIFQVIDGDGVWLKQEGGYMRVSDDFDTGDSSKLFFMGNSSAYATDYSRALLFEFTKIASTPASITIRGKQEANGSSSTSTGFELKLAIVSDLYIACPTATQGPSGCQDTLI